MSKDDFLLLLVIAILFFLFSGDPDIWDFLIKATIKALGGP